MNSYKTFSATQIKIHISKQKVQLIINTCNSYHHLELKSIWRNLIHKRARFFCLPKTFFFFVQTKIYAMLVYYNFHQSLEEQGKKRRKSRKKVKICRERREVLKLEHTYVQRRLRMRRKMVGVTLHTRSEVNVFQKFHNLTDVHVLSRI